MATTPTRVLLLIAATAGALACDDTLDCTDQGCTPSYTLHLESAEPDLETGLWHLELEVDGATISADCTVSGPNEGPESIPCEVGSWTIEPDRPVEVLVSVNERWGAGSGEPTDTGDPPERSNQGIFVTIQSGDEEVPFTTLEVVAELDGAVVFETQRSPTYEIDDAFNGPGCGSCPRPVEEIDSLP